MTLTLEEANRIAAGAVEKARQLNIRISAAVVDAGGRLVAFQRMDNAIWASAYGSQGKAVASAAFGRASGELQPRADQPTPRGIAWRTGSPNRSATTRNRSATSCSKRRRSCSAT